MLPITKTENDYYIKANYDRGYNTFCNLYKYNSDSSVLTLVATIDNHCDHNITLHEKEIDRGYNSIDDAMKAVYDTGCYHTDVISHIDAAKMVCL